ncbi:hypothetical protein, partial [Gordonia aichiensis]
PETGWIRTWLDTVLDLPWNVTTEDSTDIKGACPAPSLGLAEDVYNEMGCCDEDLDDPEDDHRFHFHPLPKV